MIGSTVNPALGRIDYSPIVQGAQSAAQSIQNAGQATGQMYANLGKQISSGFEQYQKNKEERDFYETAVTSRIGQAKQALNEYKANPAIYGNKPPINEEIFKNIPVEDIPKMSIGKLKSYTSELDNVLQESRGALAKANAIRQAERDIKAIADNKFFTQAYADAQGMQIPTGVSTSIKATYQPPTLEEKLSNLSRLSYGKAAKEGAVISGGTFDRPNFNTVPESIKNFIRVNAATGAAELRNDEIDKFNKIADQALTEKADLRYNLQRGVLPDFKVESFAGGVGGGYRKTPIERPMTEVEKEAANNLYKLAETRVAQVQETQKAIDEAKAFVQKDAQGPSPAEIKMYVSKDPNLTPLQSASFELVTKPEFRNATAQEKTDKVLSNYIKEGGELSPEFLAKVKAAFKTDIEKTDIGGGKIAVTYGNNIAVVDTNKKNERIPLGEIKKFEQDNYQALLNKAATTYPSWDSVPDEVKALLASLTAVYGPKDISGMTASPLVAFNSRREALRGTPAPAAPSPILSKPISATSGWSIAR